jgi:hypothetical protein
MPGEHARSGESAPHEAFELLANPFRFAVIEVLWEADEPVGFSDLRRRAGIADSGQFNYHLSKLTDRFVRGTDEGYTLREAGRLAVQVVRTGAFTDDPVFGPVDLDAACQHCGAPLAVSYDDEQLVVSCTREEGHVPGDSPPGTLFHLTFPPAGVRSRSPEAAADAALVWADVGAFAVELGVCRVCTGPTERTVRVCADHEGGPTDDGAGVVCPHCDTVYAIWSEYVCANCRDRTRVPAWHRLLRHPAVVAFFDAHGLDSTHMTWELFGFNGYHEELLGSDPLSVRITVRLDGDELALTLDESLDVVSVE